MAEFKLDFLIDRSDEALLVEVRRVAEVVNKPVLTRADFNKHARVSADTLCRRLGDWKCILEQAGLGHLYSGHPVTDRMRNQKTRSLSDEEIIHLFRKAGDDNSNCSLSTEGFQDQTGICKNAIIHRFGSWKNFVALAGRAECAHGRRYTDEECYANLFEVWTHLGRCPHYREMNQQPSTVGAKAYIVRWGTWRKALAVFVEWANSEEPGENSQTDDHVSPEEEMLPSVAKTVAPSDRREIPLRMRWRVLQRDRFRCVSCGRSPATHLNVDLHVDHIMPFTKGGKTVIENLRSLCKDCNLGKGDLLPE